MFYRFLSFVKSDEEPISKNLIQAKTRDNHYLFE